jgi:hypothetical protein
MAVLGKKVCGDACGVQGEGRGREVLCLPLGNTVAVWRKLCPCLNPLGSTGKRPVGPERSVAALRAFDHFDFFRAWVLDFLRCFVLQKNGKETGPWGQKTGAFYQGSEGKKQRRIRAWMHFHGKKVVEYPPALNEAVKSLFV